MVLRGFQICGLKRFSKKDINMQLLKNAARTNYNVYTCAWCATSMHQGSVLGPLLSFLLFINDLKQS